MAHFAEHVLAPRERLVLHGAKHLQDEELIALVMRSGTSKSNVIETSRALLSKLGGLTGLGQVSLGQLRAIYGIGLARAASLVATSELGKRMHQQPINMSLPITSPERAFRLVQSQLSDASHELFVVIALDTKLKTLGIHQIARGKLNQVAMTPKEVFSPLLRDNAHAAILAHNHPSGCNKASADDLRLTRQLKTCGEMLGVAIHDHIIVAGDSFTSLAQLGEI